MTITTPCTITSRCLPGVRIGNTEISITYSRRSGREGRTRYQWHVDGPAGEFTGDDLQSGCGGGSLQEGLTSLLSFLGAAAESWRYKGADGENSDLFPQALVEWTSQNSDKLTMARLEIEESGRAVIEE